LTALDRLTAAGSTTCVGIVATLKLNLAPEEAQLQGG
jgi:hypothetical protein